MLDGVFFINSALSVNQLSVFNNDERFQQTVNTIKSIQKYCPNNRIFIFDGSFEMPKSEYVGEIENIGADFIYTGNNVQVNQLSKIGQRSLAETLSFIIAADYFKSMRTESKRIYKLSGRYILNDNFILDREDFKNAFVFNAPVESWMPKQKQEQSGVDKLFKLRFWHMDSSLFNVFQSKLPIIFNDCFQYGIDVEHSYYKNLNMYKTIAIDPIGVEGVIAPTGEYINE